jgi:hypothetical protein
MRRVAVDGAALGVEVEGSGEPVLLLQTGLVADEFLPLAAEPTLRDHYRVIRYHRRVGIDAAEPAVLLQQGEGWF